MALGGGVFITQNKVLPGAYINFVNAARAAAMLSERGYVAMPLELDWGQEGDIFRVDANAFQADSLRIFGYPYAHEKLKGLRDLFRNARTGYFYRLNGGGAKAANAYATALYGGVRGNALMVVIEPGEAYTEETPIYDVSTLMDGLKVDTQTVSAATDLKPNDYVTFATDATLALTAGTPLTGGADGTTTNAAYQSFLDKAERYTFNVLGLASPDETVKALFAAFTRRMRDEVGVKFQLVTHRYVAPEREDYEGVISVENNETPELVYWVAGAMGGCAVNASNTNKAYDGEYTVDTNYTQLQLADGKNKGKLMLHQVGDHVRVLEDINTFVTYTETKGGDFSSNQTVRVLDQIANDIAVLFATKYLGQTPNDEAGRISLWNDIVKHHQELEQRRAIERFAPENVTVGPGETKKAVVVSDLVTPTNAMAQLYMTVVVE